MFDHKGGGGHKEGTRRNEGEEGKGEKSSRSRDNALSAPYLRLPSLSFCVSQYG